MERDLDLILDGKVSRKKSEGLPLSPSRDVLHVADQYYVLATSIATDRETRVLKQGETFAVFDSYGDVWPVTNHESGIFHRGTRYLSRYEFGLCGEDRPLLLNSTLRDDNGLLKVDMTNRDLTLENGAFLPKGSLHIHREKFVIDARCFERMKITNYASREISATLVFSVGVDFADIFEVRGLNRPKRGRISAPVRTGDRIVWSYVGLDEVQRELRLRFLGGEFEFVDNQLRTRMQIAPKGILELDLEFDFVESARASEQFGYREGLEKIWSDHSAGRRKYCAVRSSNEQFDEWLRRSTDDLVMMTTPTSEGELYPYAGIPWFCAAFGRDGILTALECLWANPSLARGVLKYLAETQSLVADPSRDATPGKIIHELRFGEMANLREIPFGRYYGSIDSTPLFVALGGAYLTRTGDLDLVRSLWPSFERALEWMDRYGDVDGDGFIEYQRESPKGLVQQGWKDSTDSIFHEDGSEARGPVALCEVQAYAYMARVEAAKMAAALGFADVAARLNARASELRAAFDRAFWLEDLGTFALALDGDKRACRVRTSNAGQCLFTGIVMPERVDALVRTLMAPESFTGWGVRTVASDAARYNPMSYHNGSVWPHDVALIAWGLSKYGYKDEVERLFNGLFRAATYMDLMRMPEVFCGFVRRDGEAPTLYPHACSPQAWSAASVYMLIQSLLGLEIDALAGRVCLRNPRLPDSIESLRITSLSAGGSKSVDAVIQNYFSDVSVQIPRRSEGLTIVVEK